MSFSIVEYFGDHDGYRCGYCGQSDSNYSRGMWAHELSVQDYQFLLERGWRRSGKYCYKPTMNKCCCPMYMIRIPVAEFKPTRSQKRLLKKVHKYLSTGEKPWKGFEKATTGISSGGQKEQMETTVSEPKMSEQRELQTFADNVADVNKASSKAVPDLVDVSTKQLAEVEKCSSAISVSDPDKQKQGKAKQMRIERKKQKLVARAAKEGKELHPSEIVLTRKKPAEKTVEDFLNKPLPDNPAHRLEIKLVRSRPENQQSDFCETFEQTYDVYKKYQMAIHHDPEDKCTRKQFQRFLIDSPLEVTTVRSSPGSEKFRDSFLKSLDIFQKYQIKIHNDKPSECSKSMFTEFLVDSPLQSEFLHGSSAHEYGSFHQQYWLDGKLIAVGVIDILPNYVSSVYLYYDPDYGFLSLGTYAALREAAFVRSLVQSNPDMKYYCMGYYIHSCPKMRYKGRFKPSYLLCPESYSWLPLQRCALKLNNAAYSRFDETGKADCDGNFSDEDLANVRILHRRHLIVYGVYKQMKGESTGEENADEDIVREFSSLVGKKCALGTLLLYRSSR